MISLGALAAFSTVLLFWPPTSMMVLLDLMPLPLEGKAALFGAVMVNVLASFAYERWGCGRLANGLSWVAWRAGRGGERRAKDGNMYKAVMGGEAPE